MPYSADTPYTPAARPPSDNPEALAEYIDRELREIARVLTTGVLPYIRGDRWYQLPPRPQIGDLAFLDGSIGQGGQEGWHEYVSQAGGTWVKL